MVWVLFAVFGSIAGVITWEGFSYLSYRRDRLWEWRSAVAKGKLDLVRPPSIWRSGLTANVGDVAVRIENLYGPGVRAIVEIPAVPGPPGFSEVSIRRELFHSAREIEVGDKAFDKRFFLQGPAPLVTALLNDEVRGLLVRLSTEADLSIADGELRVNVSAQKVAPILRLLLDLRRQLAQPLDVPRCLAQNARQDPEPGVRLHNLLLLLREFPGEASTAEALRAAHKDASPEVRLRAAMELGPQGRGALLALAERLADDVWSAKAVAALDQELPLERAQVILARSLRKRRLQTARACVELLGRYRAAAVADLAPVLTHEKGELAAAAAWALGATGQASAEPPLLLALQREEMDVKIAAADALAHVGTAAAVLPLRELAESSLFSPALHRAAREAVAEIQSRLQGSPGELSLADAEAGQLSLADAEAGQLSLATDPAGQLSIPRETS
jgi:hypothetical protein